MSDFSEKLEKYIEAGHKWIVLHGPYVTYSNKETIKEVAKEFYSQWNSRITALLLVETSETFKAKENKNEDCRGNFKASYYDKKGKMVFNEDELTKPLNKVNPNEITADTRHGYIAPNGAFYECGYECHRFLAKELIITDTVKIPLEEKEIIEERYSDFAYCDYFESKGWIKISDSRISDYRVKFKFRNIKYPQSQFKTLIKFIELQKQENFEYLCDKFSRKDLLAELNEFMGN